MILRCGATLICISKLGQHWFRWWFVAHSASGPYLNWCLLDVNCPHRHMCLWDLNQVTTFWYKNVDWKMLCTRWMPFCRGLSAIGWQWPKWTECYPVNRGHPTKRALPDMLTHGRKGPFGRIPSKYARDLFALLWLCYNSWRIIRMMNLPASVTFASSPLGQWYDNAIAMK